MTRKDLLTVVLAACGLLGYAALWLTGFGLRIPGLRWMFMLRFVLPALIVGTYYLIRYAIDATFAEQRRRLAAKYQEAESRPST